MDEGFHMMGGSGDTSYAANSLLQRKAMLKAQPMVKQAVKAMVSSQTFSHIVVADLGCSSGPNSLLAIHGIWNTIMECFESRNTPLPDVQLFLNDLPGNDFNNLFRLLVPLRKKIMAGKKSAESSVPFYVGAIPGSFYERIFPDGSVHFIHSSYSLHFLSQVPERIRTNDHSKLDNTYIYLSKSTPRNDVWSYKEQYNKDFSLFLELRAKELVHGGYMSLLFIGRSNADPTYGEMSLQFEALAEVLKDMLMEGLVEEIDLNQFKLPLYFPSIEEIKAIVKEENSFVLEMLDTFSMNWDPYFDELNGSSGAIYDEITGGRNVANHMRAGLEPMLKRHLKGIDVKDVFTRYARKVGEVPEKDRKILNIVLILKRA